MLTPIEKTRLSDTAVEAIREFIDESELSPGDKLPSERKMSQALNISRASVREALRVLEIIGLIEVKPGSGIYYKDAVGDLSIPLTTWLPYNEETMRETYEVRQLIEPRAAELAAQRATPEILEQMRQCMREFRQCVEKEDLPGMILADIEFHRLLAEATQNKTLTFLMRTITRFLPEAWKASLRIPQRPEKTILEHQQVYEALAEHSPDKASDAMALHLATAVEEIDQFDSTGEEPDSLG
jgi:GntR family transcriptional repressor for pyruvate dehydrogenase complex